MIHPSGMIQMRTYQGQDLSNREALMCIICVEYQKGLLTADEAWLNAGEMKGSLSEEHKNELLQLLLGEDEDNVGLTD